MGNSPFTFILAHILGVFYLVTFVVMGLAMTEQVMSLVTPYEPVILEVLQGDNR